MVSRMGEGKAPGDITAEDRLSGSLDAAVVFFVSLYLFLNPFPHVTAIKQVAFHVCGVFALGLWAFQKRQLLVDAPVVRALLLFLAWAVITAPFAVDRANTAHDIYAHFVRFMLVYMIVVTRFGTDERLNLISRLLLFSCLAFICWAIFYYYIHLDHPFTRRLVTGPRLGALGNTPIHIIGVTALFGAMLSLHETSVARRGVRVFFAVSFLIFVAGVFLTQSRGVILALFAGCVCFGFFSKGRSLLLGLIVLLVLLVVISPVRKRFSPERLLKNPRLRIYRTVFEVIKDYPVAGIGYGMESYRKLDADAYDRKITDKSKKFKVNGKLFIADPHNWIVGVTARTGFVGLALYLLVVYSFFKMGGSLLRSRDRRAVGWGGFSVATCFALLVAGLFEPTFTDRIEIIHFSLFALTTIAWRLDTQKEGA